MGQLLTQDLRACTVSGPATTLNDRPKSAYPEVFRFFGWTPRKLEARSQSSGPELLDPTNGDS
jgi:hypothetical protein